LIAVLGVPLLMGMLGSVLIAVVSGQANRAIRLGELVPLMLGGLAFAAIMLGMMSAVRYALFGSGPLELPLR
jgi:hypothetical protein